MAVPEPLAAWVEVLQEAVPELLAAVGVGVALVALFAPPAPPCATWRLAFWRLSMMRIDAAAT